MRKNHTKTIIVIVIFIIESVLWFVFATVDEGNLKSALLGILTSLNASIIFYVLSEYVFSDPDSHKQEMHDEFAGLHADLKDLSNVMTNANEIINNGLVSVRQKDFYDVQHEFWHGVLDDAESGLDFAGYTLSSWFKREYEQKFTETITRLVNNGKLVRIIMLDPKGKTAIAIDEQIEGKIKNKLDRSDRKFRELYSKISPEKKQFLDIRYASNCIIPYMYIRNDNNTIISPYMFVSSSRKSFLTVFKKVSSYSDYFANDFALLFDKLDPAPWIEKTCMQIEKTCIQKVEKKITQNAYSGHGWSFEDTIKYIFTIKGNLVEAGFFIHYCDKNKSSIIKHVIELSTSYGCPMKCKFCASSNINGISSLTSSELNDIFTYIYKEHNLSSANLVVLTLTGTGDYFYNHDLVMPFLSKITYQNIAITVSSVCWTPDTLLMASEIKQLRNIQITYISADKEKTTRLIPHLKNVNWSFEDAIHFISNSSLSCFRINYLMIDGVNDSDDDFKNFISMISEIKNKLIVRISKLNETRASQKNSVRPADAERLKSLCNQLNDMNISAYIFCSEVNDNMNCGQLITEQ